VEILLGGVNVLPQYAQSRSGSRVGLYRFRAPHAAEQ